MRKIWYAFGAYVLVLFACAIWRWHIGTYGADTGLFGQAIADTFGGMRDGPEQGTHFRFHWAPLLATLWPLIAIFRTPLVLQFAQAALIGAGIFPLYSLAAKYLGEQLAFPISILWLLYPPILGVAFTEFHEIAFYPAIVFALVWALDRERWIAFGVLALLSALVREEACIVLAVAGASFAVFGALRAGSKTVKAPVAQPGRRSIIEVRFEDGFFAGRPPNPRAVLLAGAGLALVNVLALVVYYDVIIPKVGPWEPSRFYVYPFASGPVAVLLALATHPANIAALFPTREFVYGRVTYLLESLAPLAFLPLFSRWTLLAVPGLLIVLLASDQIAWRMGGHYPAIYVPWLVLGALAVLVRLHRRSRDRNVMLGTRAALAISALVLVAANPLHPQHYLTTQYPENDDVRKALATIPAGARVALHDEWYTHVALEHPYATVFFCPYVDYLVYADDFSNGYYQQQIKPEVAAEVASGQAKLVQRFGKVAVYSRTPDTGAKYGRCLTARDGTFATLRDFLKYDLAHE